MEENIQTGVFFSNGMNGHQNSVDFQELEMYLRKMSEIKNVWIIPEVTDANLKKVVNQIKAFGLNRIVIAGDMPGLVKDFISKALQLSGESPDNIILADFREHGAISFTDTEIAKALITCAIHDIPFEVAAIPDEVPANSQTLVIGGGIAGIQAALEIANANKKVYLVERKSTIGGHMAMFDKTFPTLDCAACILTPKMVDVSQNSNIDLLTYSEVEEIQKADNNYKVTIRKKSRFVNDKCTGCGDCEIACPVTNIPQFFIKTIPSQDIDNKSLERLENIISRYSPTPSKAPGKNMLIQIMQDINQDFNYLPDYSLKYLSEILDIPLSQIYHVATFYSSFSLTPRGEHLIKICIGTACHTRGAARILDEFERQLQIKCGDTTPDLKFTLDTVNCLGCCALAPVITVDEDYHTMSVKKVGSILKNYNSKSPNK